MDYHDQMYGGDAQHQHQHQQHQQQQQHAQQQAAAAHAAAAAAAAAQHQHQQASGAATPPAAAAAADFFLSNYRLGKTLGIGSFGKVKFGNEQRENGRDESCFGWRKKASLDLFSSHLDLDHEKKLTPFFAQTKK